MAIEMLDYLYRVSRACCGKKAELLNTYQGMYSELVKISKLPRYMVGYHSVFMPDCLYKIAEGIGRSYDECYEVLTFVEYYDVCYNSIPDLLTLTSSEFNRNKDFLSEVDTTIARMESFINNSDELLKLKTKGIESTSGDSRVFTLPTNIGMTGDSRSAYNEDMLKQDYTRIRWLIDMIFLGEQLSTEK